MTPERYGQLAALATAFCWALSTVSMTDASRRVGSLAVNIIRLTLAAVLFSIYGMLSPRGLPLPTDAPAHAWTWLLISGFIGFFLGDLCLFKAFVLIGARLTSLIMSLAPPITALLAIPILGERLWLMNWVGMAITLAGVSWVALERQYDEDGGTQRISLGGIALGVLAAVGQAVGAVLSKLGMGPENYDAFASTQIRVFAGLAGFAVLLGVLKWYPKVLAAFRQPRALASIALGTTVGPFLGVALFLTSLQTLDTGVAQTIVSIFPVLVIPFVIFLHKEKVSLRAIAGAMVAFAGILLLFS